MFGHGKGYGKWGTWRNMQRNKWQWTWWDTRFQAGSKSWGQAKDHFTRRVWKCSGAACGYAWNKNTDQFCAKCGKDSGWTQAAAGKGKGSNNWRSPTKPVRARVAEPEPTRNKDGARHFHVGFDEDEEDSEEATLEERIASAKEEITALNRCIKMAQQLPGDSTKLVEEFQKTREGTVDKLTTLQEEQRAEAPLEVQLQAKQKFETILAERLDKAASQISFTQQQIEKFVEQNQAAQERAEQLLEKIDQTKAEITNIMSKMLDAEQRDKGALPRAKRTTAPQAAAGTGKGRTRDEGDVGTNNQTGGRSNKRRALALPDGTGQDGDEYEEDRINVDDDDNKL
jgi:hypothetical protein